MNRPLNVFAFLFVVLFGVWGCAQGPAGGRTAEARAQRLEDENKAAVAARDAYRVKLAQAEEAQVKLRTELDRAKAESAREREALTAQLKTRTAERDQAAGQYDTFRKSLRDLIGQADAAAPPVYGPPRVAGTAAYPTASTVSAVRN